MFYIKLESTIRYKTFTSKSIKVTIFDTLESINNLIWAVDKLMQRLSSSALYSHSHDQLKASSQLGNG
jgi:hypothetical protein